MSYQPGKPHTGPAVFKPRLYPFPHRMDAHTKILLKTVQLVLALNPFRAKATTAQMWANRSNWTYSHLFLQIRMEVTHYCPSVLTFLFIPSQFIQVPATPDRVGCLFQGAGGLTPFLNSLKGSQTLLAGRPCLTTFRYKDPTVSCQSHHRYQSQTGSYSQQFQLNTLK